MEVMIYATFAGLPCISVPVGFNADGLPMGIQLIGRPQDDAGVLALAAAYEEAIGDWLARLPQLGTAAQTGQAADGGHAPQRQILSNS